MKSIIVNCLLLAVFCCFTQPKKKGIEPINSLKGKLYCFQKNIQCGKFKTGEKISCAFLLRNIGLEPVEVLEHQASCNCTAIKLNSKVIGPGDTLRVSLVIDTKGKPTGSQSSTVILKTNGERVFFDLHAGFEIE